MNLVDVVDRTRAGVDGEAAARLVARVLHAEGVDGAELSVAFVGERRIRALNAAHRGRDEVTDVLSFPLEEAGEWDAGPEGAAPGTEPAGSGGAEVATAAGPPRLLGDVVICARQALRQARADGLPPAFELAVLLAHGTLHLLGYDHEADAGQMAVRQAEVLELVEWEGLVAASR
ncbi:MAG: rRNA maturation RNase YbeY [Thermoleophilia bacterium]